MRRIFASVTKEEKEEEGREGKRRRKRRRGRKKEKGGKEEKKKGGGIHSQLNFHYSICVSIYVHRSLSPPAAAAAAYRAELRYSVFIVPPLPFFYFRPPLPPLLPSPPPPAPPSPPLLPPFVFFFPPTSAILCLRFLLVSGFDSYSLGHFRHLTFMLHFNRVFRASLVSSGGAPATDLATMCLPPPIECISNRDLPLWAGVRPTCFPHFA